MLIFQLYSRTIVNSGITIVFKLLLYNILKGYFQASGLTGKVKLAVKNPFVMYTDIYITFQTKIATNSDLFGSRFSSADKSIHK